MFKFHPVDLTDLIAITALSIGFILAILGTMNELSMSPATGFFGYIGGVATGTSKTTKQLKNNETNTKEEEDFTKN